MDIAFWCTDSMPLEDAGTSINNGGAWLRNRVTPGIAASQIHSRLVSFIVLWRIGRVRFHDPNLIISELVMCFRKFQFRHMTENASLLGDGAGLGTRLSSSCMARKAFQVVRRNTLDYLFVHVMTSRATDTVKVPLLDPARL